jgi:hypothetical protein
MGQPEIDSREFSPGNACEASGIYLVRHDPVHIQAHEVTVIEGENFPPCRNCGHHPRFRLMRAAVHIVKHPEFVRQ